MVYFFGTSPTDALNEIRLVPSTDYNGKILDVRIDSLAGFTENYITYTTGSYTSTTRPVLFFFGDAFVGLGNKILRIDSTTNGADSAEVALTFDTNEIVIGLHKVGDQIIVYTSKKSYLWDGVSLAPLRGTDWPNQTIMQSINTGDNQLVITKALNENYLWLSNGYTKKLLYRDSTAV